MNEVIGKIEMKLKAKGGVTVEHTVHVSRDGGGGRREGQG